MKPKLELVDEKNFKAPDTTKHDLKFKHIGDFNLKVEVDPVGDILLMYFKQQVGETQPSTPIEAVAAMHGCKLPQKPFVSRWACRTRLELRLDMDLVPMQWRVKKQLKKMKKMLANVDERVAKNRQVAKRLMEE